MGVARDVLNDRISEIESYIDLLIKMDTATKNGSPLTAPNQYHIMVASTYILLYNMVESTIIQLISQVEIAITQDSACPRQLTDRILSEWISNFLGTKAMLSHEARLEKGKLFFQHIISNSPPTTLFNKGGGGNWDDEEIYRFSERFGVNIRSMPKNVTQNVKIACEDGLGCMKVIVRNRNKLAHGEVSFCDCGKDKDIQTIQKSFWATRDYLKELVEIFENFLTQRLFIATL